MNDHPHISPLCHRGTFSNGAFHWMVREMVPEESMWYFRLTNIVSFDVATETFGEVLPPPVCGDKCDRDISFGTLHYYKKEHGARLKRVIKPGFVYGLKGEGTLLKKQIEPERNDISWELTTEVSETCTGGCLRRVFRQRSGGISGTANTLLNPGFHGILNSRNLRDVSSIGSGRSDEGESLP
ncbi:F-box associated domain containing protein [Tanacetum coccineum]